MGYQELGGSGRVYVLRSYLANIEYRIATVREKLERDDGSNARMLYEELLTLLKLRSTLLDRIDREILSTVGKPLGNSINGIALDSSYI